MMGELIGEGGMARIHLYGEGKAVKISRDIGHASWIESEAYKSNIACEHNIVTPKMHGVIELENSKGIIYDKVEGITLGKAFGKYPFRIKSLAKKAARSHSSIHKIKNVELEDQETKFINRISAVKLLTENQKNKIIKYLKRLPDNHSFCHGDLHVENYMYDGEKLYVIDWLDAYSGHPAGDIARTMLLMNSPTITAELAGSKKVIVELIIKYYNTHFLKEYFQVAGYKKSLVEEFRLPIAAIRLSENIPYEEEWLMNIIESDFRKYNL